MPWSWARARRRRIRLRRFVIRMSVESRTSSSSRSSWRRTRRAHRLIRDNDVCINFNYRADRAREITMALMDKSLEQPSRALAPKNLFYATLTEYDKSFGCPSSSRVSIRTTFSPMSWRS